MAGQQDFSCDFVKPTTAFWRDLDWTMARNFFQAFPKTEQPALERRLEPLSDRCRIDRLKALIEILQEKLPAPELQTAACNAKRDTTRHVDREECIGTPFGIASTQAEPGLEHNAEKPNRITTDNCRKGKKNLDAQYSLAWRMEEKGRYREAEDMALKCLERINEHPRYGPLSPRAISLWRLLIITAWKSGRRNLAEQLILDTRDLIMQMSRSKFAKYAKEEVEELVVVTVGLAKLSKK